MTKTIHVFAPQVGRLFAVLALILICILFSACNSDADVSPVDAPESTAEPKQMCDIVRDGRTAYTIIRADTADAEVVKAATTLWKTFENRYGVSVQLFSDWTADNKANNTVTSDSSVKEILIGATNRAESRNVTPEQVTYGFLIKEENGKIVIWGSDAEQTVRGMEYFMSHILIGDAPTVEEGYLYISDLLAADSPITLLVNQYAVVYPALLSSKLSAPVQELCAMLGGIAGREIRPVTDAAAETQKEILIGKTTRAASVEGGADLHYMDYRVKVDGDKVLILGGSALATMSAIAHFVDAVKENRITSLEEGYEYHMDFHGTYLADSLAYRVDSFVPVWADQFTPPAWMTDFEEKLHVMTCASGRYTSVAHMGGDIQNYPWNSLEGLLSALMLGADVIEMDLRLTRDNVIVLMHDPTLTRTTNVNTMKGRNGLPNSVNVADWTYAELQQLNLVCNGRVTEYKIPTAYEALALCRNRTQVAFDIKVEGIEVDTDIYLMAEELDAKQCFFAWRGSMAIVNGWVKKDPGDTEFVEAVKRVAKYLTLPGHSYRVRSFSKFEAYGDGEEGWAKQFRNGAKYVFTNRIYEISRYIAENQSPCYPQ